MTRRSGAPLVAAFALMLAAGLSLRSPPNGAAAPRARNSRGAGAAFPGAPLSQAFDADGDACPRAPAGRYLPPWSGCVTAVRAELTGDGRPDLVVVYSHLARTPAATVTTGGRSRGLYAATAATLEVVRANGTRVSSRIAHAPVAAVLAIAHVSDRRGQEVFLQVSHISSGNRAVAYGLDAGRLIRAGGLGYGGDSGNWLSFDCLAGRPAHIVQRRFVPDPRSPGRSDETEWTLAWRGPRLVARAAQARGARLPVDRPERHRRGLHRRNRPLRDAPRRHHQARERGAAGTAAGAHGAPRTRQLRLEPGDLAGHPLRGRTLLRGFGHREPPRRADPRRLPPLM